MAGVAAKIEFFAIHTVQMMEPDESGRTFKLIITAEENSYGGKE
jgi:hypothetical protein